MSYFNPNEGVQEMEQNPSLQENTRNKPKKIRKNKIIISAILFVLLIGGGYTWF